MEPHLRLHPGQEMLTPAQEAEVERFAEEWLRTQLSTEPVDEPETERLLRQAHAVAGLPPPDRIEWLDGPLGLDRPRFGPPSINWQEPWDRVNARVDGGLESGQTGVGPGVRDQVKALVRRHMWPGSMRMFTLLLDRVQRGLTWVWGGVEPAPHGNAFDVVAAYEAAPELAYYQFFDTYLAPNDLHAFAQFNARVSGYQLDIDEAIVVRRPHRLTLDADGNLHSATDKCVEYPDGWGFYAWHGVVVPERVILAPERLTREDFLKTPNLEVRRVMQERMGPRFMSELEGGVLLDEGPGGRLYEVHLPHNNPELVARYVLVQDSSTARQYFLQVPPTVETSAEAVAWSFQMSIQEYDPAHET